MKTKVAIVAGGNSSEYEVSLRSAGNIKNTLDKNLYDAVIVLIHGDRWQAVVSDTEKYDIDKNDFSYADAAGKHVFDFAYITIHGTPGENGIVQGYFELLGMKYSCCGVLAAALTFNKYMCNRYLESVGANPAPAVWLHKGEEAGPEKIIAVTGLPCFVKSNVSGSSFGVSKVTRMEDVGAAVANAFAEGDEVIVESFLKGTEVTCGIYKTKDKTVVLPLTEVVSKNEFFDFNAKYNGQSEEITPARLDAALTADRRDSSCPGSEYHSRHDGYQLYSAAGAGSRAFADGRVHRHNRGRENQMNAKWTWQSRLCHSNNDYES